MPTSNWQNISHSIELIRSWMPQTVLDIGCGFGRWGVLCREFLDVWEARYSPDDWQTRIEAIEGFAPYITSLHHNIYDQVHVGLAQAVLPRLPQYDLIIVGDMLEHLDEGAARGFLALCRRHLSPGGHLLVHVPLGDDWPQDDAHGNDLERHRSVWNETDLRSAGAASIHHFTDYIDRPFATAVFPPAVTTQPTSSLRFAFATAEYPTAENATLGGGIGTFVRNTARWLADRGHDVHVVISRRHQLPADATDAGVHLHQVPLDPPNSKDPVQIVDYARAVARQLEALHARAPLDVVLAAEWSAEGWAFTPSPETVFAVSLQSPSHVIAEYQYHRGTAAEQTVSKLERRTAERAHLLFCPSLQLGRRVARDWDLDDSRLIRLPNPLPLDVATPIDPTPSRPPLLVDVNRLTPLKAPDVLIRAVGLLHRDHPDLRIRLIGRGGDWNGRSAEDCLGDLANGVGIPRHAIELVGARPREAMPAELAAATLCVNPSLSESYSYTSAEALASGRPLVLTDGQGIAEYLRTEEDCLVVPAGDASACAEAIRRLLADVDLRTRLGRAARRTFEGQLSCDAALPAFEQACLRAKSALTVTDAHASPSLAAMSLPTRGALPSVVLPQAPGGEATG